jgi:anti-sigma regulatory factor (Ser/Thr protein kinase)
MSTIEVRFSPLTVHVRTARLVALSVARRARVDEEQLDEVRLAVSETCSRAVSVHLARGETEPVTMRLSDDRDRFTVEVINVGTLADDPTAAMDLVEASSRALAEGALDADAMPVGFGLAVVSGLVEDLFVTSDDGRTTVRMSWPIAPVLSDVMEPTGS